MGLVALLVVAAAVGSFLVLGGDDDEAGSGGDAQSILLEPIGVTLADDFAGNLDLENFSSITNVLPDVPPLGSAIASALAGRSARGDQPGLYGGTRDAGTCDVEALVEFLTDDANLEKAEAWAGVQGIEVDGIEDFVAELTPVRLRFDTRVTNHGFADGVAFEIQSVLEAGTAVLVDRTGAPRVKCNCGNPLAEPDDVGDLGDDDALDAEALVQNLDDAWDGFDPVEVVVIEAGDEVDVFVLVDIETGDLFVRPVGQDGDGDIGDGDLDPDDLEDLCEDLADSPTCDGGGGRGGDDTTTTEVDDTTTTEEIVLGTGDVQITLEWSSNADLDLAVVDPTGDEISFSNRGPTATGGQLDVDSNVRCPADAQSGVENVFWPQDSAPSGTYTVVVTGFAVDDVECGSGNYTLTIAVIGQAPQVIRDEVGVDEEDSFTFTA